MWKCQNIHVLSVYMHWNLVYFIFICMDEHKINSMINPYTFLKSVFLYFDRECIDDRNFVFPYLSPYFEYYLDTIFWINWKHWKLWVFVTFYKRLMSGLLSRWTVHVLHLECGVSCMRSDPNKILHYKSKTIVTYSDRSGLERENIYQRKL